MAKFLLAYHGGSMPKTTEAQQQAMAAWGAWFGTLGDAVVDPGDPCFTARTVTADGTVGRDAPSSISGYTLISADSLDTAASHARTCPVLAGGASIEVIEIVPVM